MARSLTETAVAEIGRLLMPLKELDGASVAAFVRELGWEFDEGVDVVVDLSDLVAMVETLGEKLLELAAAESQDEAQQRALELATLLPPALVQIRDDIPAIETALNNLPNLIGPAGDIALEIGKRILDYLLYEYARNYHSRIFAVLHILGILEIVHDEYGASVRTLHRERITLLFSDPMQLADNVYQWRGDFNSDRLLARLELLTRAFLLPGGLYRQSEDIRNALGRVGDAREMRIPLFQGYWPETYGYAELDINLSPLPASPAQSKKAGLALYPYVFGGLQIEQDVDGGWNVWIRGNADFAGGFGVEIRAPHTLAVTTNLFSDSPLATSDARLEVGVGKAAPEDGLVLLFGSMEASRLGYREIGFNLIVALSGGKEELAVEFEIKELTLAITSDQADGFLQNLLSGINIETSCDLVLGYSNLDGVYFRGSGALEIEIPIHQDFGPIHIATVFIGVSIDEGFQITLATSFGTELGPFSAVVEAIGLRIPIAFPPNRDGNLGLVQVEAPGFKSPTGAGFSIDAGITGGGFLEFDDVNERYAGILALKFGEIGIVAIGLITTKMPDGSKGFSMLVNLGVTFDPPFQLSMGFTLSGVGGLVGVNRTMMIDVLREGVKKRTLDSILFPEPEWVIPNAAKVISDLRAVFPPAEGRFVIGPMVKIGYGTPNIIVADIGIFLELFDPIRIVLLGQLSMDLPEPKDAIVRINLDIVGVLDFEKKELSFQASLYDSGILTYELFGDAAFFLSWGAQSQFAMSLGGFHPKFTPPPPPIVFADLRRLGLNLSSGSDFQLSCNVYQALTPNSLQFGARADLYAAACGAEVTGYLSFDTLIYFSPFSFEIDLGAGVTIRYQGACLADIRVTMHLSGPTPWNARGTAVIKVLFFDIDVKFNITWGRDDPVRLDPVDPWPQLEQALLRAESWGSRLPAAASMVESLHKIEDEPVEVGENEEPPPTPVIVHPAGTLEIIQNVAPLEFTLEKMGNAPVRDHDRFRITELTTADGATLDVETVDEFFARGQFETLSNSQKLSLPAFERLPGGVTTRASTRIKVQGEVRSACVRYESIVIMPDRTSEGPKTEEDHEQALSSWDHMRFLSAGNASRRSALRAEGRARFAHSGGGLVGTAEEKYVIVHADTLEAFEDLDTRVDVWDKGMTRSQADQALAQHLVFHPGQAGSLMVVGEYEVEGAE